MLEQHKQYSFMHISIETWNGLNEEVQGAVNVHSFKENLIIPEIEIG